MSNLTHHADQKNKNKNLTRHALIGCFLSDFINSSICFLGIHKCVDTYRTIVLPMCMLIFNRCAVCTNSYADIAGRKILLPFSKVFIVFVHR